MENKCLDYRNKRRMSHYFKFIQSRTYSQTCGKNLLLILLCYFIFVVNYTYIQHKFKIVIRIKSLNRSKSKENMKTGSKKSDGTKGNQNSNKSRWRNNKNKNNRSGNRFRRSSKSRKQKSFKGQCEALKDAIYDCSTYRQMQQFILTTKKIALYVGRNWKNSADIVKLIDKMEEPNIPIVADIDNTTATDFEKKVWDGKVKSYLKRLEQGPEYCINIFIRCLDEMANMNNPKNMCED